MSFEAVVIDVGSEMISTALLAKGGGTPRFGFCREFPRQAGGDLVDVIARYRALVPTDA